MNNQLSAGAPFALLLAGSLMAAPQEDVKVVPAPQVPAEERVDDEPLFHQSERLHHDGRGVVETMEEVLRRQAAQPPAPAVNKRERNGRPGTWRVPRMRRSYRSHSGDHYVFNQWGDTRMGLSFNAVVDLHGAWFAGHGPLGGYFSEGLEVIGYRAGVEVARVERPNTLGLTYEWFAMDLAGVDRIEIVSGAAFMGMGYFAMDDLSFTEVSSGKRRLIDFEDLTYEDVLTGSGYEGLTWEEGSGPIPPATTVVSPPGTGGAQAPTAPGAPAAGGFTGKGAAQFATGQGTLPTLVQDFVGPRFGDAGANALPPDTCGAVGINHFVSVVNSNLSIYVKSTGTRVMNTNLDSFFGGSAGDPRVVFDPDSERFFIIATDFSSRIWVAASSTSDPTGSWFKTNFNPGQGSDAGKWPDYPTLGVDSRWLMTSAYMVGGGQNMTLFCIEKAPLVAAGQSMGTIHAFRNLLWEGAIQPAVHWDEAGEAYAISYRNSGSLRVRTINPPANNPTMSSGFVTLSSVWSSPPSAPALGSGNLDALDGRLINSVYRNGSLWTCHAINTNGRASSRYYEVNPATNQQIQLGTVRDNQNQTLHFFNPSIAVNSQGHAVLGCTASHAGMWPGAWYTGRLASDAPGEMAFPVEYKNGGGPYTLQGGSPVRWGDYSLTSADPVDDTVWTIQEFSRGNGSWGNRIAQLDFDDGNVCSITRYCDPSALGTQIDATSCSLSSGSIIMTYSGGTPGQVGYLLVGSSNGIVQPPGATGNLCLSGGALGRYIADAAVIDPFGMINTDIINGNVGGGNGTLPNVVGGGPIQAGDTWNWQFWARHQGVSSTFSDALSVTFQN